MRNMITLLALVAITLVPLALPPSRAGAPPEPARLRGIVSLTPSITDSIVDLEASDLLVGVSSRHGPLPEKVEVVGDLVRVDLERIIAIAPDLVLFSAEDGSTQMADRVSAIGIAVHRFGRNRDFDDICAHYLELGAMLGREQTARARIDGYRRGLARIERPGPGPRMALFVSHVPLIPAGAASFVGKMIESAGGRYAFAGIDRPFPVISAEHLVMCDPDIIVSIDADPESFFADKAFAGVRAVRRGAVRRIDADLVGTYTPRNYVAAAGELGRIIADVGK